MPPHPASLQRLVSYPRGALISGNKMKITFFLILPVSKSVSKPGFKFCLSSSDVSAKFHLYPTQKTSAYHAVIFGIQCKLSYLLLTMTKYSNSLASPQSAKGPWVGTRRCPPKDLPLPVTADRLSDGSAFSRPWSDSLGGGDRCGDGTVCSSAQPLSVPRWRA